MLRNVEIVETTSILSAFSQVPRGSWAPASTMTLKMASSASADESIPEVSEVVQCFLEGPARVITASLRC